MTCDGVQAAAAQRDSEVDAKNLAFCQERRAKLTAREQEFIESAKARLDTGSALTEKQVKWLSDIADKLMPSVYVSVGHGMRGYFSVLIEADEDGVPCPVQTGIGSYKKREGAIAEGRSWAEAEGIEFLD